MACSLPNEIFSIIFSHVTNQGDLGRCCRVSKQFFLNSQPFLYQTITLQAYSILSPTAKLILSTLRKRPYLYSSVREVKLQGSLSWLVLTAPARKLQLQLAELLEEILNRCNSLEVVILDNILSSSELDQVIENFQVISQPQIRKEEERVKFRIIAGRSLIFQQGLSASYEGCLLGDSFKVGREFRADIVLQASRSTLRHLCIDLLDSTSVAIFQNLEHLALRLPAIHPSPNFNNLARVLPSLPKLQSLTLTGTSQHPQLAMLFCNGQLANILPPLLDHLSLAFQLSCTYLFAFLHNLPETRPLRKFNCLQGRIPEEMLEFVLSTALKAQGNAHFAKKEWDKAIEFYTKAIEAETETDLKAPLYSNRSAALVHKDRLEEALNDANACIDARPTWSKAYARLAEVFARKQLFLKAITAYEKAIERAEDPAAKARYEAALKLTKATSERNAKTYTKMSGQGKVSTEVDKSAVAKLSRAFAEGWRPKSGGSLELLAFSYNVGKEGFQHLEENIWRVNGQEAGNAGTNTNQELSECILLDPNGLVIPAGSDPSYPLVKKFSALQRLDYFGMGLLKYYESKASTAKTIIADLARRKASGEDWLPIRRSCSVLIRGNVLTAFINSKNKEYGNAIEAARTSLAVIDEGNRVWKDVEMDDKGNSFKPTMKRMIKAFLLELQLEAARDAFSSSARKVFTLEAVEANAQEILSENPQSEWPSAPLGVHRLGYYVLPTARAYLALGFVYSQRAGVDLVETRIPSGKAALAKLDHARKSARYYDLASKFLPDDDVRKPQPLYMGLQQHLRAGGKKVSEVFKLAEEAEKIRAGLTRFYEELDQSYLPRDFVQYQVQALRDWLGSPGAMPYKGVEPIHQIVKPIPTLNLRGTPPSFNPNTVLNPQFWLALEGEVGMVDVLGLNRNIRGDYA
ncbi:hypothetical protein JCM3765_006336 [Sporobolomyces pararoseus]